ncbi:MAG TPA: CRISPR-associated primase-polymerase type B [Candidatus Paceibacterota bacterium]|nr:CRISPR-associated primase-polymerase type B [Candidatus Paceibacterota bacterium]
MIQIGRNITSPNDPLVKGDLNNLYQIITNPDDILITAINRLRTIQTIDQQKYRQLKTMLPYFVCGFFNPAYRRTENFAHISHFVIDIDHVREKELEVAALKQKICTDQRVAMAFISPSNNGIKLLFNLTAPCYDHGQFSVFYKIFAYAFSKQYGLDQVVDKRTSDVTRACFLSIDYKAYYNPDAEMIAMETFVNFENQVETKDALKLINEEEFVQPDLKEKAGPVESEVLEEIRRRLNPNIRVKPPKIIFVPETLNEIMDQVARRVEEFDIQIKSVENINYGKKMVFTVNNLWAELNIFYGKKGFTVVKTPKKGSNEELADIVQKILCELLM